MSGEKSFRCYTRATRNFFELSNYILLAFNLGMFPSLQLFIDLKPDQFVVQYSEIKTVFNFTSLISNKWFVQDVIGTSSAHGVGLFQYCSIPEKGMGKMDTCYRLGLNLSVSYGFEVKLLFQIVTYIIFWHCTGSALRMKIQKALDMPGPKK